MIGNRHLGNIRPQCIDVLWDNCQAVRTASEASFSRGSIFSCISQGLFLSPEPAFHSTNKFLCA